MCTCAMSASCYHNLATSCLGYQTYCLKNCLGKLAVQAAKQLTIKHSRPKSREGVYTHLVTFANTSSRRGSFKLFLCFPDCPSTQTQSYLKSPYHPLLPQEITYLFQPTKDHFIFVMRRGLAFTRAHPLVAIHWIFPTGKPTLLCGLPIESCHPLMTKSKSMP